MFIAAYLHLFGSFCQPLLILIPSPSHHPANIILSAKVRFFVYYAKLGKKICSFRHIFILYWCILLLFNNWHIFCTLLQRMPSIPNDIQTTYTRLVMEEKKQSVRIQTSILNAAEKKCLVWLAERMPRCINSDTLTVIGVLGAVFIFLGYLLSNYSIYWLWLSCFGLVVNWYGDSLDGTLARVRNCQRPRYGYYLDHNIDCINEALMFVGAGLSGLMNLSIALAIYAAYLALTVYVSINAHLKSEFKLTYGKMGPTEFRLIIFLVNILFMYIPFLHEYSYSFEYFGLPVTFGMLDYVGLGILVILLIMYLVSFIKDARYFAKLEPLHKPNDEKKEANE